MLVCVCGGGGAGWGAQTTIGGESRWRSPVRRYYLYENTIVNLKGQHINYSLQFTE